MELCCSQSPFLERAVMLVACILYETDPLDSTIRGHCLALPSFYKFCSKAFSHAYP
jgi:hypothetical protein